MNKLFIPLAFLIINFDIRGNAVMLFNISISSVSIFHGRRAVAKWRRDGAPSSAQRSFLLRVLRVNLSRNNCILVRDRWCHLAVRNLVFHNFAIWRATCIETPRSRGDDCYMAGKREDNPRIRGNRKLGFPTVPTTNPMIPSVKRERDHRYT